MIDTEKPIQGTAHTTFDEKLRLIRFRMSKEQLRFSEEIRLIPRKLVLIVAALFVIAHVVTQLVVAYTKDPIWPEFGRGLNMLATAGAVTAASLGITAFLFLVAYVNRDAARRGMNSTMWTVLVLVLLPAYFVTGFIIYFVLREPLPYPCPQCNAVVSARYNYCPSCKFNLRPSCPGCRREVRLDDRYCPHCAQELAEASHV
jgi:hypothetical protein